MKNNELVKSMEFVMKLLHKEWERSGAAKKEVILDQVQMDKVMTKMAQKIGETQDKLEEEMTFRQSVTLSHENYIVLRTMKKFITAKRKLEKSGAVFARILLDKEETGLYLSLVPEEQ